MRYPALAVGFLALAAVSVPGVAVAAAVPAASALTATFTNPTPFAIADDAESSSLLDVSGLAGNITGLTLTIAGLNHTYSADLVIGLRSLDLDTGIVVMSQVGTFNDIIDATLTFSDFAAAGLTSAGPVVWHLPSQQPRRVRVRRRRHR